MANLPRVGLPGANIAMPFMLLLTASLAFAILPAQAQNSVNIRRDQLERVEPYHAPRQFMILDESPRVTDYRRPKEISPNYVINIAPLQNSPAQPGTIVLTPEHNGLSQSGFQSQIPAGGLTKPQLAPTVIGGQAPVDRGSRPGSRPVLAGSSARPIMSATGRVGRQSAPPSSTPASYGNYQGANAAGFDSRFSTQTKADLHGRLLTGK